MPVGGWKFKALKKLHERFGDIALSNNSPTVRPVPYRDLVPISSFFSFLLL